MRARFFVIGTLLSLPPTYVWADSAHEAFFANHSQAVMITGGAPVNRRAFDLFLKNAPTENQQHTLYAAGYYFPGTLWVWPIRNRLEINYLNHIHERYRHFVVGWVPELLFNLKPCYIALGAGPEIKSRPTPVNGGYFFVVANLALGVTFDPVTIEVALKHFSNFYTSVPNDGIDFVTLSVGFSF
ncbi:acyloxyacyl hydrolase [Candidatus Hepatobacter penaei]|uniref:acyloxyacyl hydrolase n=1 Tax=Candidatus Hepatobacter penaei TaxID=1274402 RepID=UPI0004F298F2|nr:acyloxyacyl hydrolase [Candidatus Hepatobacter penaei]